MNNKCLGVFLVVITIPLVMLSIIQLATINITKSQFYKDLLKKSDSYRLLIKTVPKNPNYDTGDLLAVIQNNMTPDWLEQNTQKNLDHLFAYLNNQEKNLNLKIDISPFHEELIAGLSPEMQAFLPKEISLETYIQLMQEAQSMIQNSNANFSAAELSKMKDQIASAEKLQQQFDQNTAQIKQGFYLAKIATYIIYALTLLMLIIIAIAARHWVPAIFRWTGWTLFIPAMLLLAISLFIQKLALNYDPLAKIKMSGDVRQILTPLYHNFLNDISSTIGKISIVCVIIGLLAIILSYILAKYYPEQEKTTPAPSQN